MVILIIIPYNIINIIIIIYKAQHSIVYFCRGAHNQLRILVIIRGTSPVTPSVITTPEKQAGQTHDRYHTTVFFCHTVVLIVP